MDVLDDLFGESEEVTGPNPWLTYGEPLHRLREFGITIKEMDLLDEGKLASEQMRAVVAALLGGKKIDYPRPEIEWELFKSEVKRRSDAAGLVWSPTYKKMMPWVLLDKYPKIVTT